MRLCPCQSRGRRRRFARFRISTRMTRFAFQKLSFATALCVALTTWLAAAPPQAGAPSGVGFGGAPAGPGFNSQNNPGVLVGSQAAQSGGNPGFSSTNNPGVAGSEFGRATAADASVNGRSTAADASDDGRSTAAKAGANGAEHRSGGGFFRSTKSEVMVEKPVESAAAEKPQRSAASKLFDASLLYAGVTPIPSATPGGSGGPANNPGLEHMSAQGFEHSAFGLATAQAATAKHETAVPARVDPIPSASPAQRPSENRGVNPVPSAPESRGISPLPRED